MKIATIIARSILGLIFVVFGINYFLKFLEVPKMDGHAAAFMGAIYASGYLGAVKVLEIIGGALTLSGRYTPLGLLILGPIVLNIAFFHIFMAPADMGMAAVLGIISLFLLYAYRSHFAPFLCCKACKAD